MIYNVVITCSLMYWTGHDFSSIQRAGMDGSDSVTLVTGLDFPVGVTIDVAYRRLYWAENGGNKTQSSDLDGRDIQFVIELSGDFSPFGIAALNDRIYWGDAVNYKLGSCTKDGQDVQTLYTGTSDIHQLTIVPTVEQPRNRTNDCVGRNRAKLCVLSPSSYRCLD